MSTEPEEKEAVANIQAEQEYPVAEGRVTKWFGVKRVDWCWGNFPDSWKSSFRHWLEIPTPNAVLRHSVHQYECPAYFEDEGAFYTAFTQYFDGVLPCEEPLLLRKGAPA